MHPEDSLIVYAVEGESVILVAPVTDGEDFQWSRTDGAIDSRWASSSDGVRATLTTESATLADSGEYVLHSSGAPRKRMRLEVRGRTPADADSTSPFFLRRLTDLAVKVGARTRLIVEIQSDSEVQITWYRNSRRLQPSAAVNMTSEGRFHCLELNAAAPEDSGRWTCAAANKTGRAECSAHLNVIVPKAYKRPEFLEELRAILTDQGTVSLECKVVGVPTPTLRWFKDSEEIRAGDVFALTANPDDATSLGIYTCEASNCMGKAYSSSKVHVVGRGSREGSLKPADSAISSEPAPIFISELQEQRVKVGEPLEISCRVGVPPWPKSVVWYNKNGRANPTECTALEDGAGGLRLTIPSVTWDHEGEWKCVASSAGGRLSVSTCYVNVEVPKNYRKPRFMENLKAVLTEEGLVSFECKVVGFPTPQLSWFKDGLELKPGDVYQLTGSNSLGSYCCIAKNCMGQASSQAELTVEDIQNQLDDEERMQLFSENKAPKFVQVLKSQEAKINEDFRFSVKVSISPEPTLTWYRDDQPIDESPRYKITKESKGIHHLDIRQLEITDQAEWKCVATNEFGHSVSSCFLKLVIPKHFKKPRFLENLRAILSEEGAVNLECKVIGVPQPVLKWYKDGEELKPGDIHRIISGQDGTCCLGTYTCEAQNCMGIAASSASLLGFEDTMKAGKVPIKSEPEPLQRNISLSTIHEERTSQLYDTPVGDITLDEKGEISFSFSGKEVSVSLYETPDLTEEEALQIVEMYADQLSENITEQNVVELPPLRFVKETSTSGNLLMEAIVIDVSPDYFTSPEDDLRTEADMEDISIIEDIGAPTFPVEITEVPVLHHTAEEFPERPPRKKSESVRSGDDYYSLSKEKSTSEKRKHAEGRSESDQQSFGTANSVNGNKGHLLDEEIYEEKFNVAMSDKSPKTKKMRKERKESTGSRRSSSSSEKSLDFDLNTKLTPKVVEDISRRLNTILKISKVVQGQLSAIEDEVILQSAQMSSAATAKKSLEVIDSLKIPLTDIHKVSSSMIADDVLGEKMISIFQTYIVPLKLLHQNLAIIEKCVEIEGSGRTLVQRTSICLVETLAKPMQSVFLVLKDICCTLQSHHSSKNMKVIHHILDDTINALSLSEESIKSANLIKEASEIQMQNENNQDKIGVENNINIIQKVWKPIFKLQKSLESVKQNVCIEQDINMQEYVMSLIARPIQELQNALETIEEGAVKESNEKLYDINSVVLQSIVDPMLALRNDLDLLKNEMSPVKVENTLDNLVNSIQNIKSNLVQIGEQFDIKDIEPFEENQKMIQSVARNLLTLQNNVDKLSTNEKCSSLTQGFDKLQVNLAKLLEATLHLTPFESVNILKTVTEPAQQLNESFMHLKENNLDQFISAAISSIDVLKENISNIQISESADVNDCLHCSITSIKDLKTSFNQQIKTSHDLEKSEKDNKLDNNIACLTNIAEKIKHEIAQTTETDLQMESIRDIEKLENISQLTKLANILIEIRDQIGTCQTKVCGPHELYPVSVAEEICIKELATPLNELHCSLNIASNQLLEDYESIQTSKNDVSPLKILIKPLQDFHENLTVIQHNVHLQIGEDLENFVANSSMAKSLRELDSCLLEIQQQYIMEAADDMSTLQDISGFKSVAELKQTPETAPLKTINVVLESTTPFDAKDKEKTIQPLYDCIVKLQTSLQIDEIEKFPYPSLQPLIECLKKVKLSLERHNLNGSLSEDLNISDYQEVSTSLADLQILINEITNSKSNQTIQEENIDGETFKTLHIITESLLELQQNIYLVKNSTLRECKVENAIEKLSSQRENLAVGTEPMQYENVEDISTATDITLLKSLALPLQDLKHVIGALQQESRMWESHDDFIKSETPKEYEKIIVSLQEVLNGIATVENILTSELEKSLSENVATNEIRQIASPLQDLSQRIIAVQETFISDLHDTEHSIKDFSYYSTLAEAMVTVEKCYAVLEQHDLLDLTQASDIYLQSDNEVIAKENIEQEIFAKSTVFDNALAIFTDIQSISNISEFGINIDDRLRDMMLMVQSMLRKPLAQIIQKRNDVRDLLAMTEGELDKLEIDILASKMSNSEKESAKVHLNMLRSNLKKIDDILITIYGYNKRREVINPLKRIKHFISAIESIPIGLSREMPILENIVTPLLEICHQFELADLSSNATQRNDISLKINDISDSVKIMSAALKDFALKDNTDTSSITKQLKELNNVIDTNIQEFSSGTILQVKGSFLRDISEPLYHITDAIVDSNGKSSSVSDLCKNALAFLKEPVKKVQECLSNLENQLVNQSDDDTLTADISLNESFAEPVIEMQKELNNFEECYVLGESLAPESQKALLSEMEKSINSFHDNVLTIRQACSSPEEIKCLDMLKSSINEMENAMHEIENQFVTDDQLTSTPDSDNQKLVQLNREDADNKFIINEVAVISKKSITECVETAKKLTFIIKEIEKNMIYPTCAAISPDMLIKNVEIQLESLLNNFSNADCSKEFSFAEVQNSNIENDLLNFSSGLENIHEFSNTLKAIIPKEDILVTQQLSMIDNTLKSVNLNPKLLAKSTKNCEETKPIKQNEKAQQLLKNNENIYNKMINNMKVIIKNKICTSTNSLTTVLEPINILRGILSTMPVENTDMKCLVLNTVTVLQQTDDLAKKVIASKDPVNNTDLENIGSLLTTASQSLIAIHNINTILKNGAAVPSHGLIPKQSNNNCFDTAIQTIYDYTSTFPEMAHNDSISVQELVDILSDSVGNESYFENGINHLKKIVTEVDNDCNVLNAKSKNSIIDFFTSVLEDTNELSETMKAKFTAEISVDDIVNCVLKLKSNDRKNEQNTLKTREKKMVIAKLKQPLIELKTSIAKLQKCKIILQDMPKKAVFLDTTSPLQNLIEKIDYVVHEGDDVVLQNVEAGTFNELYQEMIEVKEIIVQNANQEQLTAGDIAALFSVVENLDTVKGQILEQCDEKSLNIVDDISELKTFVDKELFNEENVMKNAEAVIEELEKLSKGKTEYEYALSCSINNVKTSFIRAKQLFEKPLAEIVSKRKEIKQHIIETQRLINLFETDEHVDQIKNENLKTSLKSSINVIKESLSRMTATLRKIDLFCRQSNFLRPIKEIQKSIVFFQTISQTHNITENICTVTKLNNPLSEVCKLYTEKDKSISKIHPDDDILVNRVDLVSHIANIKNIICTINNECNENSSYKEVIEKLTKDALSLLNPLICNNNQEVVDCQPLKLLSYIVSQVDKVAHDLLNEKDNVTTQNDVSTLKELLENVDVDEKHLLEQEIQFQKDNNDMEKNADGDRQVQDQSESSKALEIRKDECAISQDQKMEGQEREFEKIREDTDKYNEKRTDENDEIKILMGKNASELEEKVYDKKNIVKEMKDDVQDEESQDQTENEIQEDALEKKEKENLLKAEVDAKKGVKEDRENNKEEDKLKFVDDVLKKTLDEDEIRKTQQEYELKAEADAKNKIEEKKLKKKQEEELKAEVDAKEKAEVDLIKKKHDDDRLKAETDDLNKEQDKDKIKVDSDGKKKAYEDELKKEEEEEIILKAEEDAKGAKEDALIKKQEEDKLKAEADTKKKADEDALKKKLEDDKLKAEEDAKKKAEEDALSKKQEEEKLQAEAETKKNAEEDALKKKQEEDKLKAEEDALSNKQEEEKLQAEAETKKKTEEDALKKKQEEDKLKAEEDALSNKQEEEKLQAEADTKKNAEEDALKKKQEDDKLKAEADAKKKAEEDALSKEQEEEKLQAEAETKKKTEEDALKKKQEEDKLKAEEDALSNKQEEEKLQAEAETKKNAEEDALKNKQEDDKLKAEADAKKKAEEDALSKKQEEEKLQAEAETKKNAEEDALKKKQEEDKLKAKEDALSKKQEEEKLQAEAETKKNAEEDALKNKQEDDKLKAEADAKKKAEEDALSKKQEEEKLQAEAETKKNAEEDALKKKQEEDKLKAEEDALSKKQEEEKLQAEAETKKNAEEDALKNKQEDDKLKAEADAKKKAEEDALSKKQEEEKLQAEAETKKKTEEDALKKKQEEDKLKAEEDALSNKQEEEKLQAEAETKKKTEEDALKKKQEEDKLKAEEDALSNKQEEEKLQAEADTKKNAEEDALKKKQEDDKLKAEADAKKKAEEDALSKKQEEEKLQAEADTKKNAEEGALKKKQEDDKLKAEADAKKKAEEDALSKKQEEEKLQAEAETKKKTEEDALKKKQEEDKLKAEADAKKKAEEDALSKKQEEEKLQAEADTKKNAEEDALKKKQEDDKLKAEADAEKKAEDNALKKKQEELKAEADAKLKADEDALKRKQEEDKLKADADAKKKAEDDALKKKQEEDKLKAEADAKKKAKEDALKKKKEKLKAEAEAKKKAEDDALKKHQEDDKLKAESDAKKKAEEDALKKKQEEDKLKADADAKKKAEEDALKKKQEEEKLMAEADAKKKAEEDAIKKQQEVNKKKAEADAKKKAEEDALKKKQKDDKLKAEADAKKKAEEDALSKKQEEEKLQAEADAKKKAEEDALRKKQEEDKLQAEAETKMKAEEEAIVKKQEEDKLKADADAKKKAEDDALKKKQEEDKLKAEADAKKKAKEDALKKKKEKLKAEAEAKKKAEDDALKKHQEDDKLKAESDAKKKAEEDALKKKQEEDKLKADADAKKKAEEDALKKKQEEEKLMAEADAKKKAEEDAIKKQQEVNKKKAEADAKKKAEEDALKKKQKDDKLKAEADAKKKAEEDALSKKQEEEKLQAEADAKKKAEEDALRKKQEEDKLQAEAETKMKAEEEAIVKKQEEDKLKADADAKKKAEDDALKKKQEEDKLKAEADAKKKAKEDALKKKKEKLKAEAEAKKKAEDDALKKHQEDDKLKAESDAKKKAEEDALKKKQEEDKLKADADAKKKAEEDALKKKQEEEKLMAEADAKKKAEEDAIKKQQEVNKKKAEADAKKKAEEDALKKKQKDDKLKAEADAKKKAEEDALSKKQEEEKLQAEADAKKKAEEDALRKKQEEDKLQAEAETKMKAEEEAIVKKQEEDKLKADADAKKKAEDDALKKKQEEDKLKAEADAKKKAKEDALKKKKEKLKAEAEAKKKAEDDALKKQQEDDKLKAESDAKKKAEEDALKKKQEEDTLKADADSKKKAEEDALKKKQEEDKLKADADATMKAEDELKAEVELKKKIEEDGLKKKQEEDKLKADVDATKKAEEDALIKQQEENKKKADADVKKKTADDALKKKQEDDNLKAEAGAKKDAGADELKNKQDEDELKADAEATKKSEEEAFIKKENEVQKKEEADAKKKSEEGTHKKKKNEDKLSTEKTKKAKDAELKTKHKDDKKKEADRKVDDETLKTKEDLKNVNDISKMKLEDDEVNNNLKKNLNNVESCEKFEEKLITEKTVESLKKKQDDDLQEDQKVKDLSLKWKSEAKTLIRVNEEEDDSSNSQPRSQDSGQNRFDVDNFQNMDNKHSPKYKSTIDSSDTDNEMNQDIKSKLYTDDKHTTRHYSSKADDIRRHDIFSKRTERNVKSASEILPSSCYSSGQKTPGPRDAKKKPVFSTRLTDRTAVEGSRVKLTCSVLGTPEPNVQWFRNGIFLADKNKFLSKYVDGLATLEVLNAEPHDSADYTCTATNENGTISCSASLKVYAGMETTPIPPTFTRSIKDTYHVTEDEMVLECRIRGQPRPIITWTKDGIKLSSEIRYQMNYLADGVCRLIINHPELSDSGRYTCKAENALWSDEISHHVQFAGRDLHLAASPHRFETVRSVRSGYESRRPYFSRVLADHAVPIGGTIALQVEVGGGGAEVEWRRGGTLLSKSTRIKQYIERGVHTLAVENASVEESGTYTCTVKNEHGSVDTTATVSVLPPGALRSGKPASLVSRPESDVSVTEGEDFSISLRAQGDPKPKVIWMKGLRDITNSWRSLKENSDDYFRFTLKRAIMSDAGTYCILAKNCYGIDRAFVTLFVRQRLDSESFDSEKSEYNYSDVSYLRDCPQAIVGEPEVSDRGKDWISLRWAKPPRGPQAPVLAYRVDAWLQGSEGGARWQSLGLTPVNGFDAFQLTPGAYLFRVTPRNRYGWGPSIQTKEPISVGSTLRLPEFTTPLPGQVKVLVGDSITLSCTVMGTPTPTIVWYKDGQEIDGAVMSSGGRCVLHIANVEQHHEGRYTCEATGPEGRTATFARLSVVNDKKIYEADENFKRYMESDTIECAPLFSMRLRERRVQATYPVRLTCRVEGRPAPIVTWTKDDEIIEQNDHYSFWVSERFHTLEISSATLDDAGKYSAHAANPLGAVRCSAILTVDKGLRAYLAPDFVLAPDTLYRVLEGSELRIRAAVEAYPSVGVSWHRDGLRLRPCRRALFTLDRDGELEMALAHVTRRDSGVYTVTASNEVGRATCSSRVEVITPEDESECSDKTPLLFTPSIPYSKEPIFIKKPRSSEAKEGDTVVILCEVAGDPKPEVMWLRDWLKPEYYRDDTQFRRVGAGPEYRLEIPHCKLDHTGAYTVIASNCHGQAKAIISLQIYAKGPDEMDHRTVTTGRVHVLPRIIRGLKDMRCCDGDAVTFECLVQGTPSPLTHWEKDGQLIHENEDFKMNMDGEVAHLTIGCVYPEDEGVYTCTAYNELGKVYTSSCLIVDVPEEKENLLSQQLSRPPMLLSAGSTPRSTPRSTPCRSVSPQPHHRITRQRDSMSQTPSRTSRWKLAPPKFFAVPFNRVAEEGENVSFRCSIAGHPIPKVYWDKDGSEIQLNPRISIREKDDDRVLTINGVKYEDSGIYRVTLENEAGRIEATACLDVINLKGNSTSMRVSENSRTSPYVRRHLNGSHYRVGERLRLSGEMRGSPSPTSKWYRNGQILKMNDRIFEIKENDSFTLIISSLKASDSGVYTLVGFNELGCTSSWTRINVENKIMNGEVKCIGKHQPHIIKPLNNISVVEGRALELLLTIENCCIFSFTWKRNNTILPDSEIYRYVDYGNGVIGLRLEDIYMQDAGEYTCVIKNAFGSAKCSCNIEVKETSNGIAFNGFKSYPESVLAEEGEDSTFSLIIDPKAKLTEPKAVWQVAGKEITDTSHKYKLSNSGCKFTLKICRLEGSDSGFIRCAIKIPNINDKDQYESLWYTTQLSVVPKSFLNEIEDVEMLKNKMHTKPRFTNKIENVIIPIGGKAFFTTSFHGYPAPRVSWFMLEREISPCKRFNINNTSTDTVLEISDAELSDSAVYKVVIENEQGLDSMTALLQVENTDISQKPAPLFHTDDTMLFDSQYSIHNVIGRGHFGSVKLVKNKKSGEQLAAKFVKISKQKDKEVIMSELEILHCLKHPKLIQLVDAFMKPNQMIIITEYVSGGQLFERVSEDDFTLTERDSILFMTQILEGVAFMHSKNIVHLDLKPENIMCQTRPSHDIKIIDFGLAKRLRPNEEIRTLCGTAEFIAPEVVNFDPISTASDMWSIGVICYILLSGLSPFAGDTVQETYSNILRVKYDFEDESFDKISEDAKGFIRDLLVKQMDKRPSAANCLQNKWMMQHKETGSTTALSTEKLRKFVVQSKWQMTGNAIRAVGRMASLCAISRMNTSRLPNKPDGNIVKSPNVEENANEEKCKN